jgi:hypothetical protein
MYVCIPFHPRKVFINAGMPVCRGIWSVRYMNEQKCRCRKQSGTGIRGPSPVLECSGTGLRYRMPECLCCRHRPRCRCPAILNADYDVAHNTQFKFDLLRISLCYFECTASGLILFGFLHIIVSQAIKGFVCRLSFTQRYGC